MDAADADSGRRVCDVCGATFDELRYCVWIDGMDGVFDAVRCAEKARAGVLRRLRRERMEREFARAELDGAVSGKGGHVMVDAAAPPAATDIASGVDD